MCERSFLVFVEFYIYLYFRFNYKFITKTNPIYRQVTFDCTRFQFSIELSDESNH